MSLNTKIDSFFDKFFYINLDVNRNESIINELYFKYKRLKNIYKTN